jgi:hypothetical protein
MRTNSHSPSQGTSARTSRIALALSLCAILAVSFTAHAQQAVSSADIDSAPGVATTQPSLFEETNPAEQANAISSGPSTTSPTSTGFSSFIARYQARVTATQNEQPHWITPLVLVTPRLEQELRTDVVRQVGTNLYTTWNLGNSKGLEFIPFSRIEILINVPPFIEHTAPKSKDGFGDMSFNSKYRIFARNEEHGNEIVTAYFAATIPTGKNGNGSCCAVVTPTLGLGKGWGNFAITTTAGGSLPISDSKGLGHTITWNTAFQYRVASAGFARLLWPELEFNSSYFKGGANDGKYTTYATPGIVIGRVPLTHDAVTGKPGRLGLTFGIGEQIAVNGFHGTNHDLIFTARLPF